MGGRVFVHLTLDHKVPGSNPARGSVQLITAQSLAYQHFVVLL